MSKNYSEKRLKVRLRGGFSDRNGIKPESNEMQYKSINDRTRISIVNFIRIIYQAAFKYDLQYNDYSEKPQLLLKNILFHVYMQQVNYDKVYEPERVFEIINTTIYEADYDEVLTLVEYFSNQIFDYYSGVYESFNLLFKKEYVGYRFVGDIIVPITDENEIDSINESTKVPYAVVRQHISKSIVLLSDREKPDYENSIKESISAVEALCEIFTGIKGKEASLGKMLKKIEDDGAVIHSAMKSAFNILYGYTSDAKGIRHAGDIGGPSSTFDEAKFMLVSCSAFINYLIGITAK